MKRAETLAAINRLERQFPVTDWAAHGVRIWPLVRAALSWRNFHGYVEARRNEPRRRLGKLHTLAGMAASRTRALAAHARDRAHRADARAPHGAVMLTGAVGRVELGGAWYDRICDPYRELLARHGTSTLVLEPGREFVVPRHHPRLHVQPALDAIALQTYFGLGRASRLDLPGFADLMHAARREGLDTTGIALSDVAREVRQLLGAARLFEDVLRRTRAEVGWVVSYELWKMAFNLACARAGIPSIEIQHGVQGPLHWAYASWRALPPGGYDLLPAAYWTWSSDEAALIEDWAAPAFPRHRAVAGGNLWLDMWRDRGSPLLSRARQEVDAAKDRAPAERHVLIPLHRASAGAPGLEPFAAAIAARPAWRWWVRSHPGMTREETARAKRALAAVPGARLELEASELPLYAVLGTVDAVATMASSVVIEAAALGVPAAITDADAGEQFEGEIAAGWAAVADRSLAGTLDELMARAPGLAPYERPRLAPGEALDELLGTHPAAGLVEAGER